MKAKKSSKIISLLLAVLMTVGMLPVSGISAAAEESEATPYVLLYSKTCKNSEVEKLYPGFVSTKYGSKASLTKDGTLWLEGYDAGPINAFGFENFTIALKGDNKIYHDSSKHEYDSENGSANGCFLRSAIMAFDFYGHMNNPQNLTIRSYSATEKGNITITSVAPKGQWGSYQAFGGSSFTDLRALTGNKVVLNNVNLSFSIDGKEDDDYGWYAATAIYAYGGLNISNSTVDGEILNVRTDDLFTKHITAIDTKDGDTSIVNSDINIIFDNCRSRSGTLSGIWNGGTGNINIKKSNVNIRDDSRIKNAYAYGICNSCSEDQENPNYNRLNITDNSVVTLEGNNWECGIYDVFSSETDTGTAGVTVNGSELNISGVEKGIYSSKPYSIIGQNNIFVRGVNFVNAKANIRSTEEAISSIGSNRSSYGLRISGSSEVELTSDGSKVVSMVPSDDYKYGRSRIELSKGGKVTFNTYNTDAAESVMPMYDYVSLGANNIVKKGSVSEYTLTDKDSGISYTRYYGEKTSEDDILTTFSVAYVDNIDVRWNLSNNKVIWNKDISPIDTYILKVEAAANYGGTPDYKEIYSARVTGNSYTLPEEVTQYFADTVYYRIKIIPLVSASTPSETIAYSDERAAKKQVEDITVTVKDSTTVRWNAVEGATVYHYTISKYNEESGAYEACQEADTVHTALSIYNKYNKEKWYGEGKYKVSVKALFVKVDTSTGAVDNYFNILGSGELKAPLTVKHYSLDYNEYADNMFTLTVERDGTALYNPKKAELLAGDKITLYYKSGTAIVGGWYVNSRLSGITKQFSDDNTTVEFTMPAADVTAYPLVGVDQIGFIEIYYDRNYQGSYLSDIEARFNYHEDCDKAKELDTVTITWRDDDGNIITDPSATEINAAKNYIGEVTLYPENGYLFTDFSSVTLYDYLSLDTGEWTWADITNGCIENGCFVFTLYLINKATVTVPRAAEGVYDLDNAVTGDGITGDDLYSFCAEESIANSDTKNITVTKAYLAREKGEMLFGDEPSVEINGATYSANTVLDEDFVSKIYLAENVYLYSNSKLPKLNYESGTTFHARCTGTEIDIVKLTDSYANSIVNPNAVVYWQVNGGDVNCGALTDALVFTAEGSHYAARPTETELTVWVDNGPKVTYKYYTVDAMHMSAYVPKLTVSSTTFTDYLIVEVANPLPNLEYYYDPVDYDYKKDWDDNPEMWGNYVNKYGTRIRVTKSCRVRLAAKTKDGDGNEYYTQETVAETYMRDYGKPLLNLESGTAIHCTVAGVINDCVKLDATYLKTLDSNAKIAYQVNGGDVKYLDSKNDYFELDVTDTTFGSTTKITVWVDEGEKATYTYKTYSQSSNYDAVVVSPGNTEFSSYLNINLESTVPNYKELQYGIVNSSGYVSQFYTYSASTGITLERKNGSIYLVTKSLDTNATEIKLAFRTVFEDGTSTPDTANVYTYKLSAISGMATSVKVNDNQTLDSTYRYYDSYNDCASKTSNADCTAFFDPETGTLTLNGYGQGSIIADGSLNIRLVNNSTVNGYIKCDGDLYIYGSGTLSVQPLNPITGESDFYCIYATGSVQLSTSSTIDLEIEDRYSDENESDTVTDAYGIYGKSFLINNETTLNIDILNVKGANYGIYAKWGFEIDTSGKITVDFTGYSDATAYEQAPFYHEADRPASIIIKNVGYIKLKHPLISETGNKNSSIYIQPANSSTTIYRTQDYIDTNSIYTPNYYVTEYIKGVAPEITPKASITGTVASSGSPSKPVTLEIYDSNGKLYGSLTLYGNSAKYEFKNLPVGTYTIKASKAGHMPYEYTVVLEQYDDRGGLIILEMPSVSGTVTSYGDENDTVTVELWKKDGTEAEETFTGKGYSVDYIFNNNGNGLDADAEYYVVAKKENHKDTRLDYEFDFKVTVERKGVDLWLTAEYAKISGNIILAETSDNTSAVNTAVIFTEDKNSDPHIARGTVTYDELGRPTGYSAKLLADSRYIMTVYANGYKTYIGYVSTGKYAITRNVMLSADDGLPISLSGAIRSEGDEGDDITVTLTAKGDSEPDYETVVNGNDTTYLFTELSAGIYKLTVTKAGHKIWSTELVITADTTQDVTLSKIAGIQISGSITSYGDDYDDITVWLLRDGEEYPAYELTLSGDSTKYAFYGVEAGNYALIAVKSGHTTYQELLAADSDDIATDITLYLKGDVNVDGTVNIRDLVRMKKILAGEYEPSAIECQTADINGDGYIDANDLTALRQMLLGISVSVGNSSGVRVSGTVTSFGDSTADITVQLIPDGAVSPAYEATVNGNTATYSINGVTKGVYTLRVVKNGSVTRDYTLTVGVSNVTCDVTVYLMGDVNGDGTVDICDLIRLKKINAKTAAAESGTSADINADGVENASDLVDLKKKLLGLAV